MDVQVAVLCDAATESNGKLNILGAFDTIQAVQLPAVHPQCYIALRVTFGVEEEGTRKLQLTFVNDDGQPVFPGMEMDVNIAVPEGSHFLTCNFVVSLQQLKFETPGFYSVDLTLDEKPQVSIPLLVRYVQPPESDPEAEA